MRKVLLNKRSDEHLFKILTSNERFRTVSTAATHQVILFPEGIRYFCNAYQNVLPASIDNTEKFSNLVQSLFSKCSCQQKANAIYSLCALLLSDFKQCPCTERIEKLEAVLSLCHLQDFQSTAIYLSLLSYVGVYQSETSQEGIDLLQSLLPSLPASYADLLTRLPDEGTSSAAIFTELMSVITDFQDLFPRETLRKLLWSNVPADVFIRAEPPKTFNFSGGVVTADYFDSFLSCPNYAFQLPAQ